MYFVEDYARPWINTRKRRQAYTLSAWGKAVKSLLHVII